LVERRVKVPSKLFNYSQKRKKNETSCFISVVICVERQHCTGKFFDQVYTEAPAVKSLYFGYTQLGFLNADKTWSNEAITRKAGQFEFQTPFGVVASRAMSDFNSGSATHFFLRNTFAGLKIEYGYHSGPIVFQHRGNPFDAGGQFEYGSQAAINQGANLGVRASYDGFTASTHYQNFDGKLVATYGAGLQKSLAGVDLKISGYHNQHLRGAALTIDALESTVMVHWNSNEVLSGFADISFSKWTGRMYVDYVNTENKTSHLEFGQYYTPTLYKDLSVAIGWGYRVDPVKFFYVYTFVHL